ncbi:MAG: LacI family DNA-binding transcriptional regulator [Planctomycetes bacterium]|nr:LacI family DNA-binding transcriptional regulator [Planctomycetota bacterium]
MNATLKDISDATGLSLPTISQALNKRGRISAETRDVVLKAARKLGYRPNTAARSMQSGRFNNITLLCSLEGWFLPEGLVRGISRSLNYRGLHFSLGEIPVTSSESNFPVMLEELSCDGLLINEMEAIPSGISKTIKNSGIPVVSINSNKKSNCVYPDDYMVGRLAAEHLIRRGHRKIAYCCFQAYPENEHYSVSARQEGFTKALSGAGLTPIIFRQNHAEKLLYTIDDHRVALFRELLDSPSRPTAYFAYSERDALPLVTAALSLGLCIPDDISIIACYDKLLSSCGIPLTTVAVDWTLIGTTAVNMLVGKVNGKIKSMKSISVPVSLIEGGSCLGE